MRAPSGPTPSTTCGPARLPAAERHAPQAQVQMGLVRCSARTRRSPARPDGAAANAATRASTSMRRRCSPRSTSRSTTSSTAHSARRPAGEGGNNSTLELRAEPLPRQRPAFDGNNVAATDIGVSARPAPVVLRLANAGLQSRSLMLSNGTWQAADRGRASPPRGAGARHRAAARRQDHDALLAATPAVPWNWPPWRCSTGAAVPTAARWRA